MPTGHELTPVLLVSSCLLGLARTEEDPALDVEAPQPEPGRLSE